MLELRNVAHSTLNESKMTNIYKTRSLRVTRVMRGQKSLKLKEENGQKVFTACRRSFEVCGREIGMNRWFMTANFWSSDLSSVTHFLKSEVDFEVLS